MTRKINILLTITILILILLLSGCSADESATTPMVDTKTLEDGLYIDGVGPIPATVLIRSTNRLSTEQSDLIFQEYNDAVDKLLETSGQIEDMLGTSEESMNEIENKYMVQREQREQHESELLDH